MYEAQIPEPFNHTQLLLQNRVTVFFGNRHIHDFRRVEFTAITRKAMKNA